ERESKTPFNTREDKINGKPLTVELVASKCMKSGVYLANWINCLIVAPPLTITKEEIDNGVDVLDRSLDIADNELKGDK
ncbi:MAG: aspartate aminotransferase family protein, partial [Candidatus Bathyarchaeia archaeon]